MSNGRMTLIKTKLLSRIALLGFCFFAGLLGASQTAFATDSTLTITLSESTVTADVAPTATPSGTFVQSSGMTVGVSTNHISGYTLSISASDTTTPGRLKNGSSYLQSIASETTLNNFKNADLSNSDLATSLGLSDCTQITESSNCKGIWGYKPSKLNSSTNENFLPTPGTSGNTIDVTSGPNATPIEYTITLGAKVSPLATIGSYTNTFVLMAVGNNIPYTMEFSENTVENMPVNILDGSTSGTTATIPSGTTNTPTRPGYKFAGWCDQPTTKSGNNDTCATGHSHQPGDTISLNQTGANNIKLYAMWTESMTFNKAYATAGKSQSGGYYVMQDATSGICSAVDTGEIGEVKDSRDGTVYHIGKLADGKCWLLDNLALDLTNSAVLSGMTQDNTNASNTTLGYLKGTTTGTTSDQYATAAASNWTSSYSYSAPLVSMADKDRTAPDGTSSDSMQSTATSGGWKYGGYYNYCAASAGSYCYGNGTSYGSSSGNATEDICPKGWRLPTGDTSGEYSALANAIYGSTGSTSDATAYANYRSALRLPLSGYFIDGSANSRGGRGLWWSSTRYDNNFRMYILLAGMSTIYPAGDDFRYYGSSVRCVLGS